MRVGMLTGSVSRQGAGAFEAVRGLSLALRNHQGVDVHVFGLLDEATADDLPAWDGLPVHAAPITGPRAFGYAKEMFQSIGRAQLDVLHVACTWMYPTLVSLRWMRESGRPVVVSPLGDLTPWALANSHWKKSVAAILYEKRHLRRAACLHAVCDAEARAMRDYGLTNPIGIVPSGVDLPATTGMEKARPQWMNPLPAEARVLLFLGRLHHKKNIAALVEAWAAVCKDEEAQSWWLAIAGPEQLGYEVYLKDLANRSLAQRVLFPGSQHGAAKDASFRTASAFVLPSLSEGLPIAVLEALSYGLPVLITPHCNLPEGVQSGAAIEIGESPAAIAVGLRRLLQMSEADRTRMGRAGRLVVEQRFAWTQVADEMLAIYRWLLEGGAPPSHLFLAEESRQSSQNS